MACSNQWHCQTRVDVCSYPVQAGTHRPHEVNGKRPDDAALAPWKSGCLMVWDATCPDTLAASYRVHATSVPGKVAACSSGGEEEQKISVSPSRLPVCTHCYRVSGSNWPKITSLPEGVGTQDQRGDRRTQINGIPGSESVCCSPTA